jgi:CubicO group peptidase (beta-lactamase class C family)
MRRRALLVCALLALFVSFSAAAETVEKDTPRTTAAGTQYTVPAGWAVSAKGAMVVLTPPETDSALALVDSESKDADAAVAAAWTVFRPDAKWPLKLSTAQAPRSGWEERRAYEYETSPNERKTVFAAAYRAGAAWLAVIVDASDSTFEKRGGPFSLVFSSLRPKGYARESFAGKKAHPVDAKMVAAMKKFLADGMKLLDVPGVGFSLIGGGKVVFEGGLGVRELGRPERIDADTLFIAASNTKALTTLLLAELVDEKKLGWDEPVTEAYPAFRLGDEAATKQVLVKQLICACTGMPRQDLEFLFEYRDATPESAMKLLGAMQPTSRFGEVFQYSNLMAAAAGYVGGSLVVPGKELGEAYDEAMRTKVFGPLGMTHTTFDFARARKDPDVAQPHGEDVDGKVTRAGVTFNGAVIHVRPAGGVWTTVRDLDRYVRMELAKGRLPNGRRLVSEENLLARRAPQVLVSEDVTYGMGLFVDRKWGIPVVHHGGDVAGFHSDMIWLPDHGVGAVFFTNANPGVILRGPFLRRLVELLFDGKPEAEAQVKAAAAAHKETVRKERERLRVPPDPEEVAKLAPRYASAALGDVAVKRDGGAVVFDVGEWASPVASRKNDDGTISFLTIAPTLNGFEFVVAGKDGKRQLVVRDAQHEYVFDEVAAAAAKASGAP